MTESSSVRPPHLRVSPEEREEAAERLRFAAGEGRLTLEELEARLERALSAQTYGELDAVVGDLPNRPAPTVPASVRLALSYGHLERVGVWQVPHRLIIELSAGSAYLDFRSAPIPATGVEVSFHAQRSKIVVAVPGDAVVDVQELGRHRSKVLQRGRPSSAGGPAIRLTGDLYGSKLVVKRPG